MLVTILLSYVAGLLTALAPCVLPLLPVILGGSLTGNKKDRWRPYIITASLVVSLILFTLLLKASTVLIGIDPRVWTIGSGILVIILGFFMLFPELWAQIIGQLGIEHRSQGLLGKAYKQKNGVLSAVLIGAALGPIFSSCSPTYAWVIATVLPSSTLLGMFYLTCYVLGVATALLAIALLGRRLLVRIKWASDPKGWFQRGIAVLFIIVGIFVATGWDKNVQTFLVEKDFLNIKLLEEKLVPENNNSSKSNSRSSTNKAKFNVLAYDAPELTNISDWINGDPKTLENLKGKVVLIDFWTYSCINCIRTQPYLNAWHDKYSSTGLVIIGVHAPEFAFEKIPENVQKAVKNAKINYPVALDNTFSTWKAFDNNYWPAKYLIDKDGQVRYTHYGEGDYKETEEAIQILLKESGRTISNNLEPDSSNVQNPNGQSPETYLGYKRAINFANSEQFIPSKPVDYIIVNNLNSHNWSLGGRWQINEESSQSLGNNSQLSIKFNALEVFLVMSGAPGTAIVVSVDGMANPGGADVNSQSKIIIDEPRLYKIVKSKNFLKNSKLTLSVPAGVTINAFTFGG